jgi:hypothetical protein
LDQNPAAKEADKRTKQIQLKLLNSRKKLEKQNPRELQLVEVAAAPGGPTYLKVSRKEKAKEGVDKAIKPGGVEKVIKTAERSQPPPCPKKKKWVGSSSPAPTEEVPASVNITPEDASGTVRSRVSNSASKLLLQDKFNTEQDKDLFPGDDNESRNSTRRRRRQRKALPSTRNVLTCCVRSMQSPKRAYSKVQEAQTFQEGH